MIVNRYQVLPLEGLVNFKTGKLNSNAAKHDGVYPFFTCSQETYRTDTWSFDGEYVLLAGNNTAGIYPLKYFNGKFDAYQRTYAINTLNEKKLNTRYLYYALRLQLELMKSISTGVATKFLTLSLLNSTQVPVPRIPTQRKIAAILSAYDDLIENNQRRIKILEEMAQNLYREWFVKFRFPGHENTRFVDSTLGRIPEGWQLSLISDIAIIHRGRSYKGTELSDKEGKPFINLKCIERDGGFRSSGLKRYTGVFQESQTVRAGEIVMAITDMTQERRIVARAGRVSRLDADFGVISMDLVRIASRGRISETFLYALLRWSGFADEVKQHANGANVLHLLPDRINEYSFICPPAEIAELFGNNVLPILTLCESLEQRNVVLRRTRDLLLPKLISGEVDVSELDITIPEEAA